MSAQTINPADPLPDEIRARKVMARMQLRALRTAEKFQKASVKKMAALNIHAAADVGRRNRDWRTNQSSADLAIIPDSVTLIGRARGLVRDYWVAKSIVRAFKRNVVGRGIAVRPHAVDKDGNPLVQLNRIALHEFTRWAKSKLCDVERKQTFAQKQRQSAGEKKTVGEAIWMWSYRIPLKADGTIDTNKPVGLKLQSFEPEQFDLRILSFEGREVRGGVEVDDDGAPLAYHFYTRNPNDILYRHAFFSERIPASRVFHYFDGERILQSRGVTDFTPVMQDIRDLERGKGAHLTRWMMEACIGAIITTNMPIPTMPGQTSPTLIPAAGDTGQTATGMNEADFVPGMVPKLAPGESITPFVPTSPGGQYEPFTALTVRGIGAGVGMSYGQVMRQNEANYSAARQDMNEDYREWEPEQDLIVDDQIRPVYELWFNFAVLEGRFDGVEGFDLDEFFAERHRFTNAVYLAPKKTWIDPEKEANGWALLLKLRVVTREELVSEFGSGFYDTIAKLASEKDVAADAGIVFPEDAAELTELRELLKAMLANRLGTLDNLAVNNIDVAGLVQQCLVAMRKAKQSDLPVENAMQATAQAKVSAQPSNGSPQPPVSGNSNGNGKAAKLDATQLPSPKKTPIRLLQIPSNVPNYRESVDPVVSCGTCSHLLGERCVKFNFEVSLDGTCDDWAAVTLVENIGAPNTAKTFPPFPIAGTPDLETRFYPQADPDAPLPQYTGATAAKESVEGN